MIVHETRCLSQTHAKPTVISWPAPSSPPALGDGEVHVWAAALDGPEEQLGPLMQTLSSEERARAAAFKIDRLRRRYVAGRGTLRRLLAMYLQMSPGSVRFEYGSQGKPVLAMRSAAAMHFNLAHSDDLALFAFTRLGPVGVDVECLRPIRDADALVARFFSRHETAAFRKLPAADRPAVFFNLWTRKEALLKATGEGITRSLAEVEVSFLPGDPARVIRLAGDAARAARWALRDLSPAAGCVGAAAVEASAVRWCCWKH